MIKHFHKKIFLILITLASFLLICLIFANIFIKRESEIVLELNKQVLEARSEDALDLKKNIQQLDPEIKEIESYFVDKNQIVGFLAQVEELGRQAGIELEIQNVDTKDVTRDKRSEVKGKVVTEPVRASGELNLSIQAKGDWANIMAFLLVLEKMNKKVSIDGLRLSVSVNTDNKRTYWNAIFNIKVLTN